ncbi:MAG TPA: hypothetical protein VF727_00880 [Allosphingosinicella sp.]|jgi:hypothetical protein
MSAFDSLRTFGQSWERPHILAEWVRENGKPPNHPRKGFALGFPFDVLVGFALSTASMTAPTPQRVTEPAEIVFGRAESEIELKTQVFQRIFGDEPFDWAVDLNTGIIAFTSATKTVRARVQVIGTYNTLDGTFLWAWDHPSIPEARRIDARLARRFGELHSLPLFTTRMIECTEEQAWGFTAVALYLSGAQGAYRGPAGTTMVFMTFGEMTIAPIK